MGNQTTKADELQRRFPRVVGEVGESIDKALAELRHALRVANSMGNSDASQALKCGLGGALRILEPVQQANDRLKVFLDEFAGEVGVTAEERQGLFTGDRTS